MLKTAVTLTRFPRFKGIANNKNKRSACVLIESTKRKKYKTQRKSKIATLQKQK